jgi:hypothetical protein
LLKEELNNNKMFCDFLERDLINKDRFFNTIYNLILDNLKMSGKLFILNEQVDIVIKNEVDLSLSDSLLELLNKELLEISYVNSEGKFIYKLTKLGEDVCRNL